jgi:hypothetical protein
MFIEVRWVISPSPYSCRYGDRRKISTFILCAHNIYVQMHSFHVPLILQSTVRFKFYQRGSNIYQLKKGKKK